MTLREGMHACMPSKRFRKWLAALASRIYGPLFAFEAEIKARVS